MTHQCSTIYFFIRRRAVQLFLVLLVCCNMAEAQTEKYIQSLTGPIKAGDTCVVMDDKFTNSLEWGGIARNWSVNNLLTFELRYDTSANYLTKNFSCKLEMDVEYETSDHVKQQLKNIVLQVAFDSAAGSVHQGIAFYKFMGGHRVKISVKKISSEEWGKKLPPAFRIKNEIFIDRAYTINPTISATNVMVSNTAAETVTTGSARSKKNLSARTESARSGQQYTLSWDPHDAGLQGFSEYDLEWTFYDEGSAVAKNFATGNFILSDASLETLFRNNSSRVTIGLPAYQLNLLYNAGWVFHRVRGVRFNAASGVREEGIWSYAGSYPGGWGVIPVSAHEEYLNWQYSRSFAEEGKRKEVISYFDGSFRNRQSVTLNNDVTGSLAIVQEKIFDAQGRDAVSILPAPTEETTIHYFRNFNSSAITGKPYKFTDIGNAAACVQSPAAMSSLTGASQYYSGSNPKKDDNSNQFYFTKYIPDAQGYPFAVTQFTPDNTNRIRTQGNVGAVYQPGKNTEADHTTQYFYGKPQQDELDRLFGNEAGNASHFLKNMVTDANGQTSVSYINASGKTIATALAGKTPDNLQPLAAYQLKNEAVVTTLTSSDNIIRDAANLSLTYNGTFLAAATGSFTLEYEFTPFSLQVLYGLQNEKICADCYYDLGIRVTDNCGNLLQDFTNEAVFTEKTTCDPMPTKQVGQLAVTIEKPGEYNITYELKLSRKAIDFYTGQLLVQNLSLKTEMDFKRDYIHGINISGCYSNCATCVADLGTEQDYVGKMTVVLQQNELVANAEDIAWMKTTYQQLLAECALLQEGCGKTDLPCEEQTRQIRDDVGLGGQYMLYDPATNVFIERDINVFLLNKAALTQAVTVDGSARILNDLTEAELIRYWQDSWADFLLPFHPENKLNCFLNDCGKNAGIEIYDRDFANTEDAVLARLKRFWFDDDYISVVNNDPYFGAGAEGVGKKIAFINSLSDYKATGMDIMSFVRWQVYCQPPNAQAAQPAALTPCPRTDLCNRSQDEWALFSVLYLSARQEIKNKNTTCNSNQLFPDPATLMDPVVNGAGAALSCTDLHFFTISNSNGVLSIEYNGVEKMARDVTVQYVAVNGATVTNAGSVVFAAGSGTGTIQTAGAAPDLLYSIDYARCDVQHPYFTKARRNYNGINTATLVAQIANKSKDQLNTAATGAMTSECNESCEQGADAWMKKLEGCNLALDAAEYQELRDGLVAVCKSSCLFNVSDHPFGASSTPLATSNGDKDFSEVLIRVLGTSRFSTVCNDLLLDYPLPISVTPLYTNEIVRTPSTCAYNKLKSWQTSYIATVGYSSLMDFVQHTIDHLFNLTDSEVSSLLAAYENKCVTPKPIRLPASLSCTDAQQKTCLNCTEIQDESLNFAAAYAYVKPTDPDYYGLLAKYINRKYNFNISSTDVYGSMQRCVTAGPVQDSISCDALSSAWSSFEQLKPDYGSNPNSFPAADSLYSMQLVLWLNTTLNRNLNFDYYQALARKCEFTFHYPSPLPAVPCDSNLYDLNCPPQFITCCQPFEELEKFKKVFPDTVNARLLALYFSLQRSQWCAAVNLPNIDYRMAYDTIVAYFNNFKLASAYTITVRPDSLLNYRADNDGSCVTTALSFMANPYNPGIALYAVCNRPLQPVLPLDSNSCINQQIAVALGNAHSDYLDYVQEVKRDYREAYYTKCLSIRPQLKLSATYNQPLEYHYTLYYYDQAGNLVKTIPPAGVQPVDEMPGGSANLERTKNFRLADKNYCYEYGDAPFMNGNASITVADAPAIQQNSQPFTVEAFVNFSSLSSTQTILQKQSVNIVDSKTDGYKIYLDNGRLKCDLSAHGEEAWTQLLSKLEPYQFPPYYSPPVAPVMVRSKIAVSVQRKLYRSLTAQITSDISSLLVTGQWTHIAVTNTGNWANPLRIYINGSLVNTELLADDYDYTPSNSPPISAAEAAAGTALLNFTYAASTIPLTVNNSSAADLVIGSQGNGLHGSIKQVRIYNRALPVAEVRSNAYNACLVPQSEGNLVLWLPLNKETVVAGSLDRINQLPTVNAGTVFSDLYQPVYPNHRLPTHYYYNSLNGVSAQVSPDGGSSNFWYDLLGRLVVSQHSEQKISSRGEANNRYSYTKYDALGRVIEAGEKTGAAVMTAAIAKTDPVAAGSAINNWMASATDQQVTQTIYDQVNGSIVTNTAITSNQNIYNTSRKRVVATIFRQSVTALADYSNATHYQYDINGNVKRLWQEHKKSVTGTPVNLLKDIQYNYDLVSGKVNEVVYQKGKGDQFVYKYDYDPDNRLIKAYSGRDFNTLQQDAGYQYYLHGPLARIELGDALSGRMVQGCDYAYTLQGWLKGMNGVQIAVASGGDNDMGADGSAVNKNGIHAQAGKDALAYTLGYNQDDYLPIGGAAAAAWSIRYQHPTMAGNEATGKALFNGNISHASSGIAGIDNGATHGYSYGYDQLNRLREMRAHNLSSIAPNAGWNNGSITDDYRESYTYDANGNILTLFRNGTTANARNLSMDDLAYHYYYYTRNNTRRNYVPGQPLPADAWALTNQLAHVKDAVPSGNYPSSNNTGEKDIDNQANNNYTYDGIGNLVKDNAEGIAKIGWTVYGKIQSIDKTDGTSIVYDYDASGNRIQKQTVSGRAKTITNYVRDAQGNPIGVYSWQGRANAVPAAGAPGNGVNGQTWDEQHLYGSSRLGMWKPDITVPVALNPLNDAVQVGSKLFELANHLGNVVAVISDKKIAVATAGDPLLTDHYAAELINANDYTPFGMQMVGRSFKLSSSAYRYGFNGKENDNELKGEGNQQDYGMRIYDPRLGRFLSVDPITAKYPELTPYQFSSNNPVSGVDMDGLEWSPAGKVGIFSIDGTAVQLYPNNPAVIQQEKADAPMVRMGHQIARANNHATFLAAQWTPKNESEKERHAALKESWYDRDGYNADGSPTPATRLMQDKTWNAFADNIALPELEALSVLDGAPALRSFFKAVGFLEKKGFQRLAESGTINPQTIRFSQNNISANFTDGSSVKSLIDQLKNGDQISIAPIRIVEKNGNVFSLDNRRLYAYQQAKLDISYIKLNQIPKKEFKKFTTVNNGTSIKIRR
ncbi:MAG: RHS repeat-associated core domain-containing protein [Chitinophagaceae bacterium]